MNELHWVRAYKTEKLELLNIECEDLRRELRSLREVVYSFDARINVAHQAVKVARDVEKEDMKRLYDYLGIELVHGPRLETKSL